jgi:hypothetical protein
VKMKMVMKKLKRIELEEALVNRKEQATLFLI